MLLLFLLSLLSPSLAWLEDGSAVDLTYAQDERALGWPAFKPLSRKVFFKGYTPNVPNQW